MATSKTSEKRSNEDPFQLHHRTEAVYDWLLSDWEENPDLMNRADAIKILQYGGMFLTRNLKLQEASSVSVGTGSAVRKYSGAFRVQAPSNAARGGASGAGRAALRAIPAPADTSDDDSGDDAA